VLIFDRPSHVRHPLLFRFLISCIHCPANSGREFVKKLSINNLDVKISRFLCWIGAWLHADDLQHIRFRAALSRDANQPAGINCSQHSNKHPVPNVLRWYSYLPTCAVVGVLT
jgi:hypothetical protein